MGNRNGKPKSKQVHIPKHRVTKVRPYSNDIPAADSTCCSSQNTIPLYETTPETVNFFRLARLILDVCNDAMRDLLQSIISGGEQELTKRIASKEKIITTSCRLSIKQQNSLFPPNNAVVSYHSLDFTLMYTICRNVLYNEIKFDPKNDKGWGKLPHPSDTSLRAAIERIRECRNTFFAHATTSKLDNKMFNKIWATIENAVITIDNHLDRTVVPTRYINEIKILRQSSTDPKLRETMMEKIELERKYMDLFEMEAMTDRKLEEIIDFRRSFSRNSMTSIGSSASHWRHEKWASTGDLYDPFRNNEVQRQLSLQQLESYSSLGFHRKTSAEKISFCLGKDSEASSLSSCLTLTDDWMKRKGCDLKKIQTFLEKLSSETKDKCLPARRHYMDLNGMDISHMHHEVIVELLKDTSYSITLSIGPAKDI